MAELTTKQINEFQRAGLTKDMVEKIRSRAIDANGKVYQGDAGKNLYRRQQEEIKAKERGRIRLS